MLMRSKMLVLIMTHKANQENFEIENILVVTSPTQTEMKDSKCRI